MVTVDEARQAIKELAEAHAEYFKRAPPDDGDILSLERVEKRLNRVCELLALSVLMNPEWS